MTPVPAIKERSKNRLLVTDPVVIPIPDESRTSIMSSRSSRAHVTLGPDSRNTSSILRMDKLQDLHIL